jgi:RNA polymerase sigma factor (sigma-70 family)
VSPSFDEAFREEAPALHRYLRRRVGVATAEELTAETFATAFRLWERFDASRPVRPWLYGIAANLLRHLWRSEERQLRAYARTGVDPVTDDLDASIARADASRHTRRLAAALAGLRPRERELLLLHAWADLTDAEIAAALGLPIGTVKSRLSRTRERLRNQLDPSGQSKENTTTITEGEPT